MKKNFVSYFVVWLIKVLVNRSPDDRGSTLLLFLLLNHSCDNNVTV